MDVIQNVSNFIYNFTDTLMILGSTPEYIHEDNLNMLDVTNIRMEDGIVNVDIINNIIINNNDVVLRVLQNHTRQALNNMEIQIQILNQQINQEQ